MEKKNLSIEENDEIVRNISYIYSQKEDLEPDNNGHILSSDDDDDPSNNKHNGANENFDSDSQAQLSQIENNPKKQATQRQYDSPTK